MNYNLRSGEGQIKETILLLTVFPTLFIFVTEERIRQAFEKKKPLFKTWKLLILPKKIKVGNPDKGTKGSIVKNFSEEFFRWGNM